MQRMQDDQVSAHVQPSLLSSVTRSKGALTVMGPSGIAGECFNGYIPGAIVDI